VQALNEVKYLKLLPGTGAAPKLVRSWKCLCKQASNVRDLNVEMKTKYIQKRGINIAVDEMVGSDSLCMFVLMELYNGSMESLLDDHYKFLGMLSHSLIAIGKISAALCVHGDLRPEHILYKDDPKTNQTRFGLIDFGFASILNPNEPRQLAYTSWVPHSFPGFPQSVALELDQNDTLALRTLKCQVFAMFMNCLQLFAYMRLESEKWYWADKGTIKYFNGFGLGPYATWISQWAKQLPWSIDSIGNDAYGCFKFPLSAILARSGVVEEIQL
jgi:hypothetical protein